uniref:Uncharacterized protein n=1 Tax=Amphimedon queenslandica TaxID=400682 RepID=A0A1X7UH68_AMPQE
MISVSLVSNLLIVDHVYFDSISDPAAIGYRYLLNVHSNHICIWRWFGLMRIEVNAAS